MTCRRTRTRSGATSPIQTPPLPLIPIDGEPAFPRGGEIALIAGVADQRSVALLEVALEPSPDGRTVGRVLGGLVVVGADDVARRPIVTALAPNSVVLPRLSTARAASVQMESLSAIQLNG